MEKKQYDSKRPEQKKTEKEDITTSGSVTGGVAIGGTGYGDITTGSKVSINTGGGAYVGGDVSTGGGDFVGRDQINQGPSAQDVARLFEEIYARIDKNPELNTLDKDDLKTDVKDIEKEVSKGDFADESFLSRRLRNIQRMAPDILEVILATLTNPVTGFSVVVQKLAARMQQSTGA